MSLREEVFQAKVLQRLYPAKLKVEKAPETPVHHPQAAKSFKVVQVKPSKGPGPPEVSGLLGRKVYTVLPPPKDYIPASGDGLGSPSDAQAVNNADEMPVDLSGSEDIKDDHTSRKRKRRRTRKAATPSEGNPAAAAAGHREAEGAEKTNPGNTRCSESLSKNKRRKMKKKRHKEKLLALGLMPQSTAIEFTYKEEKDEEDEAKKVEEVLDFLQSTRDLYCSDRSCSAGDPSVFLSTTDSLFTRLSDGQFPPADLSILGRLRALLLQREVDVLHTVLQEFSHTSTLPKDETEAICTLFHYWITEVLPMQTKMKS